MDKKQSYIKNNGSGEVQVKIPETGVVTIDDVKKEADSKFKDMNYILLTVVVILIVMVATLLIDSFHFNSATYKEYSDKTKSLESIQESNNLLLEQNRQNQQIIIDQQKQIQDNLNK
ncbi:MAG: hypothetical protein Q7R43_00245 [Candidatus Daviesbacteria bacterium]|nr:hypothetical protein [Candidatus Daviesbacteria bacterium]